MEDAGILGAGKNISSGENENGKQNSLAGGEATQKIVLFCLAATDHADR